MMDETFLSQDVVNKQYDNALQIENKDWSVKVITFIRSVHFSHQFEMPLMADSQLECCKSAL